MFALLKPLFRNVSDAEKHEAIEGIIQHASPRQDFFLMLILSISMASFGVILNNTVIVIGSMLIAPLLYPLLSLSLGIITTDEQLIERSLYTLFKSVVLGLCSALIIGLLFFPRGDDLAQILLITSSSSSSLAYALVATIAGFAAAFATTKPYLNSTLPGVAISVALVPPLAVAGVGLSLFNLTVFTNALLLFLVNVIGIIFSAMIVFALFNFGVKQQVTKKIVKEEQKVIDDEKKEIK